MDAALARMQGRVRARLRLDRRELLAFADAVDSFADREALFADPAIESRIPSLRLRLRRQGLRRDLVVEVFALVREAASRTLDMRHYRSQLMGGRAMLGGAIAEMETGEGKTLTAALPVVAAALAGMSVHVITVNDYLAARDAQALGPLYRFFGLSVGLLAQGQTPDERRAAYDRDVTYGTNKDVVFDWLRDRISEGPDATGERVRLRELLGGGGRRGVQRGLEFAIVDEADSILVDEARTPLIISSEHGQTDPALHARALALAAGLSRGSDFVLDEAARSVELTEPGELRVEASCAGLGGLWVSARARRQLVEQALSARELFQRDRDYLVRDARVQIVDEFTGRVLADRSWERGLQQMIEAKEGVPVTPQRHSVARTTYQRFFGRYALLAGMTGTAREVAGELQAVYGVRVVRVPTHRPVRRADLGLRLLPAADLRWDAVVEACRREAVAGGRPVLVGTRSVAASEVLSRALDAAGIAHVVLNAKQDQTEAQTVARAGEAGRVTVATNMAGRGTDIRLDDASRAAGGLHVILTEFHESERIDRQLYGRCGRQGDPGSFEAIVAADDEIFLRHAPALARMAGSMGLDGPRWWGRLLKRVAQSAAERRNARIRLQTMRQDIRLERMMAFAGSAH